MVHSRSHSWRTRVPGPVFYLMLHTGTSQSTDSSYLQSQRLGHVSSPLGNIWLVMSRGIVQNFCWKPEWRYHLCSHTGLSSQCPPSVQTPTPLLQSPELEPRLAPCSLSSGQSYPGQMKCRWSSRDPQGVPGVTPGVPIPLLSAEPLQGLR